MEKKKIILSVAVAVYNEEKNIGACLSSIHDIADEIVIVDGGSTDGTIHAASPFHPVVLRTDNPGIFHINKQKALDMCHGEWILQLDADEIIPENLKNEIKDLITRNEAGMAAYFIPRRNFFWGHFMKKGGQYPDAVIRLVRRGKARFPCKSVHEQMDVDGPVGTTKNPMEHYTYRSRRDYWKKADTYTSLTANTISIEKRSIPVQFFRYCVIKPIHTFFSLYIRHKGFVDGLTGFEFSLYSALHFPAAFIKSLGAQRV